MKRLIARLRARARVIRAWIAERHAAMAALGSRTTLAADEWIGADAMTVCQDHSRHVENLSALREARETRRLAERRLQMINGGRNG